MNYCTIPKTNMSVSQISFGCMSLGADDKVNTRLLQKAVDHGINYFDTADLYDKGNNESSVGKALKENRSSIMLATKVGNEWNEDGASWRWNPTKEYILQAVDKSLKRLQTDYIDIYQLHGGTIDDPIDETIEAFELLKQSGKIREYGISSIRPNVIREYTSRSNIVSNMIQYSLLDRRPEETVLDMMKEYKVGAMVRGSLAKGLLVDKQPKDYISHSAKAVSRAQTKINELSDVSRSAVHTSLQYVLHHPAVTTAVVGIRTEKQLDELIQNIEKSSLSAMDYEALQNCTAQITYEKHR
jgi:aryl-alcohol dehydrogenase-like predicted oxidoreductase